MSAANARASVWPSAECTQERWGGPIEPWKPGSRRWWPTRATPRQTAYCVTTPAPRAIAPAPEFRVALWSDGTLQIERQAVGGALDLVLLCADEVRALVKYLERMAVEAS